MSLKSISESNLQACHQFHLGHRPALDGIRGIAVLAVTLSHLDVPFMENGFLGVDVFFVLSGFLITTLLAEEWQQSRQIQLKNFYIRRVLRLYPALLMMLLLVSPLIQNRLYVLSTLTYCTNWIMALHLQPINLELGHTWTLAIEEQYYLFWPLLFSFLLKRFSPQKALLVPLIFAVLSIVNRLFLIYSSADFWRYYTGTDAHAEGLLLGSALGLATVNNLLPKPEKVKPYLTPLTILLVAGFGWFSLHHELWGYSSSSSGSLGAVLITLLIILQVTVYPSKMIQRIVEWKPLVFCGLISYGLYLWQVPILNLINLEQYHLTPLAIGAIKTALFIGFTLLSFRYLERPIMRLKTRLAPHQP